VNPLGIGCLVTSILPNWGAPVLFLLNKVWGGFAQRVRHHENTALIYQALSASGWGKVIFRWLDNPHPQWAPRTAQKAPNDMVTQHTTVIHVSFHSLIASFHNSECGSQNSNTV
jgi:hypothetical protein